MYHKLKGNRCFLDIISRALHNMIFVQNDQTCTTFKHSLNFQCFTKHSFASLQLIRATTFSFITLLGSFTSQNFDFSANNWNLLRLKQLNGNILIHARSSNKIVLIDIFASRSLIVKFIINRAQLRSDEVENRKNSTSLKGILKAVKLWRYLIKTAVHRKSN